MFLDRLTSLQFGLLLALAFIVTFCLTRSFIARWLNKRWPR
jgi:hypothetical protein